MNTPGSQTEAARPDIQPDAYVTEIWNPPAEDGIQRLYQPMRTPEPLPEPELEAETSTPEYDPEAIVDGLGCTERDLNAYLDWAESQPVAEPEVEPELEAEL